MNRVLKSGTLFIVVLMLIMSMTIQVFADGTDCSALLQEYNGYTYKDIIINNLSDNAIKNKIVSYDITYEGDVKGYDSSKINISDANASVYNYAGETYKGYLFSNNGKAYFIRKDYTVRTLTMAAEKSINNDNAVDKTNEITRGMHVEADTDSAIETLQGFVPFINLFLGIMTVIITLALSVFTALDIAYIAFPVFQDNVNSQASSGEGIFGHNGGRLNKKTGETGPHLISQEAQYAVQASVDGGKSPLAIYFRKRVFAYIMVSVVLFIFLTGNINIITNLALKIVGFFIDVISGI